MASAARAFERGTYHGRRDLRAIGDEFREHRLSLGVSQDHVAKAGRLSRSRYCRIEAGSVETLTIMELNRIATVLGLDASVRLYTGGSPVRDRAHAERLRSILAHAAPPLTFRTEVPLPTNGDRREQRAWDSVLFGRGERTAIEMEMRLRDVQALERRLALKRRDDPTDRFLLAIADTRTNRRIVEEFGRTIGGLTRIRRSDVLTALAAGRHPSTGLVLV
jgi:transcriptional regulator with XRE-family HTH domain